MPITVQVQYFAALREAAGLSAETVSTDAATPSELYTELNARHKFRLSESQVKVALNNELADMDAPLTDGDAVVFIPPVAGG